MTADHPTIVATSGGYRPGHRTPLEFDALVHHAVELAGVSGRRPRLAYLGTAGGDQQFRTATMAEAAREADYALRPLQLFPMPNVADIEAYLLEADVIWVDGGSVANLLAVWRLHALDEIFPRIWRAGVVLAGISAGSLCWFTGGTTDSFGPELQPVTNGLALLPYGNGVHYDSEPGRRPLVHELVAAGTLAQTYCTDDGAGLVFSGTGLAEVVTERDGAAGYLVRRSGESVTEERLDTRRLR